MLYSGSGRAKKLGWYYNGRRFENTGVEGGIPAHVIFGREMKEMALFVQWCS